MNRPVKYRLLVAFAAVCAFAGVSYPLVAAEPAAKPAQPAQPAAKAASGQAAPAVSKDELAVRAQQAFNRGEYVTALPLLKKLAVQESDPVKSRALQERISVCEKALDALKKDPAAAAAAAAATQPAAASNEPRKPHPAPKAGETLEMSIKDLGNFNYNQETGGNIPDDVKNLSGATLRLRGYMIPMDQAENITQFALVPSLFSCCFGQPPQLQHTIVVNCPKGKAVSYFPDEILVEGKLNVQEKKDDGFVVSLFEVQANSVKAAPK